MTFNEFQRELQKRDIPPNIAYMLTLIYEQVGQLAKDVDTQSKVALSLAESMQGIVGLHEETQRRVKSLGRRVEGVDVRSVANEPEKH